MLTKHRKPYIGLIHGPSPHYLDHLAPLCALLEIPLVVTEEEIAKDAALFYPGLEVVQIPVPLAPEAIIDSVSVAFVCTPRVLFDEVFYLSQALRGKKIHTVWCPHGNSDKGHKTPYMEALRGEKHALVYGGKMTRFLHQKGVFIDPKQIVRSGNYRLSYYLEHRTFYDGLVEDLFNKKFSGRGKTVLYCPTWQDGEHSSSFYGALESLVGNIPKTARLVIKPHPNLLLKDPVAYDLFTHRYRELDNVLIVEHFAPIHPLLARSDLYIGDFSSIGYDYLHFDKPMIFLNETRRNREQDPGLYLHQAGIEILPGDYDRIGSVIETCEEQDRETFSSVRKRIYEEAFGRKVPKKTLRRAVFELCERMASHG